MPTQDECCTIVPYFKFPPDKREAVQDLCDQCVEQTRSEEKCLYYGFSFCGDEMHCREGYADGEGALTHLKNIGPLLEQLLKIAQVTRLEVHGPEKELAKLRGPMAKLNPQYFTLECGFRRKAFP